jgi:hypothetical protein
LPRSAPKIGGFFDLTGLSGVTSQQLGPAFGNLSKLVLKSFNDTSTKRASWFTQEGAVGCVLHQSMFEKIGRVRRHTLSEKQTCCHETVERRLKFRHRLAHHGLQERMRELAPHCRTNLCDLLCWSEPVKPSHPRCVEACGDANGRRWNSCDIGTLDNVLSSQIR